MKKLRTWEELTKGEREHFNNKKYIYNLALEIAQKESDPMVNVWWSKGWDLIGYSSDAYADNSIQDHDIMVPASKIKEIGIFVKDWEKAIEEGRVK